MFEQAFLRDRSEIPRGRAFEQGEGLVPPEAWRGSRAGKRERPGFLDEQELLLPAVDQELKAKTKEKNGRLGLNQLARPDSDPAEGICSGRRALERALEQELGEGRG